MIKDNEAKIKAYQEEIRQIILEKKTEGKNLNEKYNFKNKKKW